GTGECLRISAITSKPLRSGSPRSRMTRSGFSAATAASAPAASSAVTTRCPAASRLARRKRRIGGSSSTTSTVYALAMRRRRFADLDGLRHRDMDRQNRAGAVMTVSGLDMTALRLAKAAADRQAETRTSATPILRLHAIEFVEDAIEIA